MKKILFLFVAALLVANYSFAQYKPAKGSVSTEVQFNPFDQDGHTFKLDGIKVRYFFTDNDAFRVKLGFGMKHNNFSTSEDDRPENGNPNADYHSSDNEFKSTSGNFELNLGYERHFDLSKRLSAYVGASAGFNRRFASTDIEVIETRHYQNNNRWRKEVISEEKAEISNGTITSLPEGEIDNPLDAVNDRAYWQVKAALFAGVDFYVYKGLYLGTELGLGLNSTKFSKMKFKTTSLEEDDATEIESNDKKRTMDLGFYIEPVLRLGWTF